MKGNKGEKERRRGREERPGEEEDKNNRTEIERDKNTEKIE